MKYFERKEYVKRPLPFCILIFDALILRRLRLMHFKSSSPIGVLVFSENDLKIYLDVFPISVN